MADTAMTNTGYPYSMIVRDSPVKAECRYATGLEEDALQNEILRRRPVGEEPDENYQTWKKEFYCL